MMALTLLFLICFGLIFGSFVNALVWRLHRQDELRDKLEEIKAEPVLRANIKNQRLRMEQVQRELREASMIHGRSMCSNCHHPLRPIDLIPFVSWLWLRGRCRYCHEPIEDSGLIDLTVPVLFVISYLAWPHAIPGGFGDAGDGLWNYGVVAFGFWLVFLVGFTALALYDKRWFLLPDVIVWPLVGLALVQVVLHATVFGGGTATLMTAGWGLVLGSGIFLAIYLTANILKKEWIGFGDVKLGIVLGLLVGGPLEAVLLLYIASLLGLILSVPMLIKNRQKGKASLIPFGPFLMLACVIIVLTGPAMVSWVNRLFMIP